MKFSMPWKTPRPVAEIRPWIPPWLMGFPVTQAWALMSCMEEEEEEECQELMLLRREGISPLAAATQTTQTLAADAF